MEQQQLEAAKQLALNSVATRLRTRAEISQLLAKKGYDRDIIQATIAFLQEYGYLDDAAYCRSWIHDRIQFHPCGRQKMAFELSKKVPDSSLVNQALEELFSPEEELAMALELAEKKMRQSRQVQPAQLGRFLYGKGFGGSIISRVQEQMDFPDRQEEDWA